MPHPTQIPKWELDLVRESLTGFYTHHCRVARVTNVDDVYGGSSETQTTIANDIPCYVEGGVAHEQDRAVVAGLQREAEFFTISMPAYTDVRVGDVVVVYPDEADTSEPGNMEVEVTAVIGPESHEIERRVLGYRVS